MQGIGYKFTDKLDTHYSITTDKMITATDISGNCKAVLAYLDIYLLSGRPFYQDNKTIGKAFHKSPRTISRILNKLVTQNYIRFSYDKKHNYRIVTKLNLEKLGLAGKCEGINKNITPYRSNNNYHKIINRPFHNHKAIKPIHKTSHVTYHVHKASQHKPVHKLTTAQINILKSDAKVATKLFPTYVPKSAMSELLRACVPDKFGHTKGNIPNVRKALFVVRYYMYNTSLKINSPVAYACSISQESNSTLNNQYTSDKKWLEDNQDKIKKEHINKALGKRLFMIKDTGKNKKIIVNSSIEEGKFDKALDKLRHKGKYSNRLLNKVHSKYMDANNIMFDYGDAF